MSNTVKLYAAAIAAVNALSAQLKIENKANTRLRFAAGRIARVEKNLPTYLKKYETVITKVAAAPVAAEKPVAAAEKPAKKAVAKKVASKAKANAKKKAA